MNVTEINESICQATEIIAGRLIEQAKFDKTIRATVESCLDSRRGQYRLKYQDITFTAYSTAFNIVYANGTNVYVLIPDNDMGNEKIIIGSYDKQTPATENTLYWRTTI